MKLLQDTHATMNFTNNGGIVKLALWVLLFAMSHYAFLDGKTLIANLAVRAKGSDIEEGGDNIGHDGKTMMAKDHRNNHAAAKHELLMSC